MNTTQADRDAEIRAIDAALKTAGTVALRTEASIARANENTAMNARTAAEKALNDQQAANADQAIGPLSLGRVQMAFWLLPVVAAYVCIAMSLGQIYGIINENVLLLFRNSTLTGIGAALATRPSEDLVSCGIVTDLFTEGEKGVQLQRIQAIAFPLVLVGIFVFVVVWSCSMPVFDTTLLTMMGLVNGLYVGLKLA